VNEELLKQGLARTGYILNPPYRRLGSYQQVENKAKQSKQGIWSVQDYATAHGYDVSAVERALNKKRQDIRNMWQNK
jgi:micrococcal nuclease